MKKISICTVCMNRLYYLSQTLPVNIKENQGYPNLEFVVLNYNSRDDMDDWMRTHMGQHIESGLVKYYRTDEPEFFNLAHSKNMATKLATGDIICNIDADNYAGPGYVNWVQERFSTKGPGIEITTIRRDAIPYRDQGGKLCFYKDLFIKVNGYDESLIGYGMDDVDLSNRLENAGAKRVFIEEEKYLRFIPHSDQERIANYRYPNNLKSIYVCISYTTRKRQKALYLFVDDTAEELDFRFNESVQSDLVRTFVGWTIAEGGHRKASFRQTESRLTLTFSDNSFAAYEVEDGLLYSRNTGPESIWKELKQGDHMYLMVLMGYNECLNRRTFSDNERSNGSINKKGWGQGNVFRNFETRPALPVI